MTAEILISLLQTLIESRPLLPYREGSCPFNPSTAMFPPPQGGGGSRDDLPSQFSTAPPATLPPPLLGLTADRQRLLSQPSARLPASPHMGADGRSARQAGQHSCSSSPHTIMPTPAQE